MNSYEKIYNILVEAKKVLRFSGGKLTHKPSVGAKFQEIRGRAAKVKQDIIDKKLQNIPQEVRMSSAAEVSDILKHKKPSKAKGSGWHGKNI